MVNIGQYIWPNDCSGTARNSFHASTLDTGNCSDVIETRVEIVNKLGLHARAAAKLVACTSAYASTIEAGRDGNMVDAKSIMSVMMLAAGKGTVLDLRIDGRDEQESLTAITTLIENRFEEAE